MILVTGTQRSGTSMWMQVLAAAGLPIIGERFPRDFAERFAAANPRGFYESELMAGIYWETNPHPRTGAYLFPEATRGHAVKVFVQGLVRTDVAFIDRCIATVRPWREYVASIERFHAIVGRVDPSPRLPPALQWWVENYALVRDVATRCYPAHVVSYAAVLRDPERHVTEVLRWLGVGDPAAGLAAIEPPRATTPAPPDPPELDPAQIEAFDALYDAIDREAALDDRMIGLLNRTHERLQPVLLEHRAATDGLAAWPDPAR